MTQTQYLPQKTTVFPLTNTILNIDMFLYSFVTIAKVRQYNIEGIFKPIPSGFSADVGFIKSRSEDIRYLWKPQPYDVVLGCLQPESTRGIDDNFKSKLLTAMGRYSLGFKESEMEIVIAVEQFLCELEEKDHQEFFFSNGDVNWVRTYKNCNEWFYEFYDPPEARNEDNGLLQAFMHRVIERIKGEKAPDDPISVTCFVLLWAFQWPPTARLGCVRDLFPPKYSANYNENRGYI